MRPYVLDITADVPEFDAKPGDTLVVRPGATPAVQLVRDLPANYGLIARLMEDGAATPLGASDRPALNLIPIVRALADAPPPPRSRLRAI